MNLGICEITKCGSSAHSKKGKRSAHLWGALREHFELGHPSLRHSDVIALQMHTWSVQTLNWDTAPVVLVWVHICHMKDLLREISYEAFVLTDLNNVLF